MVGRNVLRAAVSCVRGTAPGGRCRDLGAAVQPSPHDSGVRIATVGRLGVDHREPLAVVKTRRPVRYRQSARRGRDRSRKGAQRGRGESTRRRANDPGSPMRDRASRSLAHWPCRPSRTRPRWRPRRTPPREPVLPRQRTTCARAPTRSTVLARRRRRGYVCSAGRRRLSRRRRSHPRRLLPPCVPAPSYRAHPMRLPE